MTDGSTSPDETDKTASGTEQEPIPMEGPLYFVRMPSGFPNLVFPECEYGGAFEMATGLSTDDIDEVHEEEHRISSVDFDGSVEVPIVDV